MKMSKISLISLFSALLLLASVGCTEKEPVCTLGPVTNISWEPTSGGAIITFTAPKDNSLSYVKAAYVNSLGESVYNVCSVYDNKIEISGLIDETQKYPVEVSAIDKNGAESPVETIYVTPGRAYLNIVKDNIEFETIIGGLNIKWHNPSGAVSGGKTVHVILNYETEDGPQTRFISSSQEYVNVNVRGVPPGERSFTYSMEDQVGNKIAESAPMLFDIMEETNIPKFIDDAQGYRNYIWNLVPEQTTLREVWENKNAAVFDGIIDTASSADDNSYAGTDCVEAGYGSTMPWDTDKLDIVIDMHQVVNISRIKAWQRAYWYGWDDIGYWWSTDGTCITEYYYCWNNLKSFKLFGSMDAKEWFLIQHCDIATNTTAGPLPENKVWTNDDEPRHSNGADYEHYGPTNESREIGRAGHVWELETLSPDVRYIRIRFTSNWDTSHTECSGLSEIEIYGGLVEKLY